MKAQEITLTLPDSVYEHYERVAERSQRSVSQILNETVAAIAVASDEGTQPLRSELAQLAYLNDAALWQSARATMTPDQRARLEALHFEQQQRSLANDERVEEAALLKLYRETILIRAQAALILKQRGYDVADPSQFAPLL